MRWVAALFGSLSIAASGAATAAVPDPSVSRQALFAAAFTAAPALAPEAPPLFGPGFLIGRDDLGQSRYVPGQGIVRLTSEQVTMFGGDGLPYVDSIRFSTAGYNPRLGQVLLRPGAPQGSNSQGYDLAYVRDWPQALSLDAGRLTFDVTPHAGFGVLSGGGRTAEAGALLRLQRKVLQAVGMSGSSQQSRLFLFAGATERTVGLNVARSQAAAGPDPEDGFVSEAQAGIGFQRGVVQASFGFSHQSMRLDGLGDERRIDNRVGLTLSIH